MIMKKVKYYITILAAVSVFAACNKKLDVVPQQNITPEQIKTADDVKALLFGEYSLLQGPSGYGERLKFIPDLLASANQVQFVGTFTNYKDIFNKEQVASNSIATGIWSNAYKIINLSNTVLDKIDLIDEEERDAITGEAKFMRGLLLFELVNLYAQPYSAGNVTAPNSGVPIILDAPQYIYDSTSAFVSRATIQEVYTQVLADLGDAVNSLPETAENSRVTKYTAEAVLARVYMNMEDYTNAATMANDVIESGYYNLVSTYNQAFNNVGNSSEDIFGIQQTAQSNAGTTNNGLTTFYLASFDENGNQIGGRGDAQIDPGFFNFFEDNDFRLYYNYYGYSIAGVDGYYTTKYQKLYKTIPVIRLAEMYLTRGEANLRKGGAPIGGVAPIDDINLIRLRAGASELGSVTGTNFVNERLRELAFEGDRLWTLKRLKLNVDGFSYNDPLLILPIPQREIDVNKNLVQNEGY